ncbi:alpha-2C adrenergic receptor-like [Paramacrobiotus metropolitanus]|uniref:alpha-2C adrenergic receptor-like n=1 Tax=Paramacrobiotus metropolitanus TaxID=2943436 RepID=UPI0024460031|nr:alpha-2C adrenergic receptor-like [Paramacrobiotus metropolitanus]
MPSNLSNITVEGFPGPAISLGVFLILKLMFNGCLLFVFLNNRRLRTPFTVYLINLLLSNIFITLADPFFMLESWQVRWYFTSILCIIKMYLDHIGSAVTLHAHLLITLNRMWALTFPLHYRSHHSTKTAVLICATMWTYCHVLLSPLLLQDFLYYRPDMQTATECEVVSSAQPILRRFLKIWINTAPMLVNVSAYPYLLWKTKDRTVPSPLPRGRGHFAEIWKEKAASGENRHAFWILTGLTGSIVICWSPAKFLNILRIFRDVTVPESVRIVLDDVLYSLQLIVDPILFTLSLQRLRATVKFTLHRLCSCQ